LAPRFTTALPLQEDAQSNLLSGDCFAARNSVICKARTLLRMFIASWALMQSLSTEQTRSKQGPTLRVSYVVSPIITSGPLRVPSAHHPNLAGFIQLGPGLPPMEFGGGGRTSGSFLRPLSPHAAGLTPGPPQVRSPFPSLQAPAFPLNVEGRRVSRAFRVYPATGLSQLCPSGVTSRGCTVRFMLRPADLADTLTGLRPASQ
jgi:hypothetical protein